MRHLFIIMLLLSFCFADSFNPLALAVIAVSLMLFIIGGIDKEESDYRKTKKKQKML